MISAATVAPLPVISRTLARGISPSSTRVRTTRMSSSRKKGESKRLTQSNEGEFEFLLPLTQRD